MDRIPRAYTGRTELHIRGMMAILREPEWWNLTVGQAAGIAAQETQARADRERIAQEFRNMVKERGLEPLERNASS